VTRRILFGFLIVLGALTALFFAGPRVPVDTTVSFDPARIGSDVETYLARSEAAFGDVREGLEKEIVWAYPESRAKTPVSIVYVHGFSASKGELRPLPDQVAEALGANLFYTRLTGHGRDARAMDTASVNAWVNDIAEALAVGRAIGERVIVMGTSTGGGLATWAATEPELSEDVAGLILISPNYRVLAQGAEVLTMPWGGQIARLVSGPTRGGEPRNELHGKYWTTRYPIEATLPMAAITQLAHAAPVEKVEIPALFIYAESDPTVSPIATREVIERWGGPTETLVVEPAEGESHHVLAGDAQAPSATDEVAERIISWVQALRQ
jgi:pimeloyl-ACP methyl ester carboxylesterase